MRSKGKKNYSGKHAYYKCVNEDCPIKKAGKPYYQKIRSDHWIKRHLPYCYNRESLVCSVTYSKKIISSTEVKNQSFSRS